MSFSSEAAARKSWGYKFYVTPLSMKLTDDAILKQPSFDFGFCLVDWMLNMVPVWVRAFYCEEVYIALISHLSEGVKPYNMNRRVKIISCLTRLIKRHREFPRENQLDLSKLKHLRSEMFEIYRKEREAGEEQPERPLEISLC